jgi:transposase
MPKPQPSFTAEFKHEAVQLTKTSDKPKAQIARELGISDSALYSWCRAAEAHGEEAFPGKGHQLPLEEEIHRLKRELERAQQERDILKKAISIFSRNQLSIRTSGQRPEACSIWTPPQLSVPLQARCFGFVVRCIRAH